MNPHAAAAAVGEIAVEKASRWSAHHVLRGNLSELRVVQGVEGFPAELQPPLFSDLKGLGQGEVKVVDPAGHECVAAHGGSIREPSPLDPMDVSGADAQTGIRVAIAG